MVGIPGIFKSKFVRHGLKYFPPNFIECFRVVHHQDRLKIVALLIIQFTLSILDLLGVILIGLLGALSVTGLQSNAPSGRIAILIDLLGLTSKPFRFQAAIIASLACGLLILRTVCSIYLTRRSLFFLGRQGSRIASDLYKGILDLPYSRIKIWNSQEIIYAINSGCNAITVGVIGSTLNFLTDFGLAMILFTGLVLLDVSIAFSTLISFSLIAIILYILMQKKSELLSSENTNLTISGNKKIIESLSSYREIFVKNRKNYYTDFLRTNRDDLAVTTAELAFMPNVSKYVVEISMVIGIFILGGVQFFLKDAVDAIGTLSVFLAASTRLAPAILRMQQNAITFRSSIVVARPALDISHEIRQNGEAEFSKEKNSGDNESHFNNEILIDNVSFQYPDSGHFIIENFTCRIQPGQFIAITGPSGAGKTTLVDLILGLLEPSNGSILISGMFPKLAIQGFEKQFSYVPQDIEIFEGTVKSNLILGYDDSEYSDLQIEDALRKAHLWDFIQTLPDGINSEVGERGTRLSGGERQRLGIARGIINSPKVLVLDEATSALDSDTELAVSDTIFSLRKSCTLIVIAHRLSTVKNADKVLYLQEGHKVASGTFDELRELIPNFDSQSKLLGL